ncbi:MAG: hypothetical protein DWQ10_10860 [Calditrichaeota bacterium]|nr:MAG: hypothetical protein DWQ10_10860 [Calditrichota bacterium]
MATRDKETSDAGNASNIQNYIRYIRGELSRDELEMFEENILKDEKYIKTLAALIKEHDAELSSEEEKIFQSIYKKPKRKDRQEFIRAVLNDSRPQAPARKIEYLNKPAVKIVLAISITAMFVLFIVNFFTTHSPTKAQFTQKYLKDEIKADSVFKSPQSQATGDHNINLRETATQPNTINRLQNEFTTNFENFRTGEFQLAINRLRVIVENEKYQRDLKSSYSGKLLLGDIQFLYALSHFNLAVAEETDDLKKQSLLMKTIDYLKINRDFAEKNRTNSSGRELYFLGLAYYVANEFENAKSCFSTIQSNSHFYDNAHEILEKME